MTQVPVKVGMVGAGYILESHALAVAAVDGALLQAIADVSPQRAEDAARRFGFKHAFSSFDELVASDCDVVHLLVPPHLHEEFACKLLDAGKSVFMEKPMGLSSVECRRIGELAEKKGLRLGVNHNFLFLPGYERLRSIIRDRSLGSIDQVTCNWNVFLPFLRSGPFDSWMLSAPANLFFELGPHAAAFILDLLGDAEVSTAVVSKPMELPTGQTAYRSWSVLGGNEAAGFTLSLSVTEGQADRVLRVRASAGSAQIDFGRDVAWVERTQSANPVFDAFSVADGIWRQVRQASRRDRLRRILATLKQHPRQSPYSESILQSVARFYDTNQSEVDPRQHWAFGAKVIEFCEQVSSSASVGKPSAEPISLGDLTNAPAGQPTVLVVGGTGFIGRRLVGRLVAQGRAVRVLSRSRSSAAVAFAGMPVDVQAGFHGDPRVARKAVEGIEVVYHLAKCDGKNWDDYLRGDVEPTRVLAEAAVAAGVKRFIYTGTIDSYDSAAADKVIIADTPLDRRMRTRNLYARSKAACEDLLHRMSRNNGLPLIITRPGIVIGAGADPAHIGVANFTGPGQVQYWGSGQNKLPLVLVDDVADALVRVLDAPDVVGRTFLLTGHPILSAREYVAELDSRAAVRISARHQAAWIYWVADFAKEFVKRAIRHPNRRSSTLHDWECRSHRSTYDNSSTRRALGWAPVSDRDELVERGIAAALDVRASQTQAEVPPSKSARKKRHTDGRAR